MQIGELGKQVGVDRPTIRFYESVGVLPQPERTESGYRVYAADDVDRLRFVALARSLDLPLDDIREIMGLRDRGEAPCGYVREVIDRQADVIEERIGEMKRLAIEIRRLRELARSLPDTSTGDPCVCHILRGGDDHRTDATAANTRSVKTSAKTERQAPSRR